MATGLISVIPDASLGARPLAAAKQTLPMTDIERLTSELATGDEAAFREFHTLYFDRLYRFLLAVTRGSEEEAQEVMQQTFLRVLRYVRPFQDEAEFWSWLKAVARSASRDNGRKRQRYLDLLTRWACFWRRESECRDHTAEPPLNGILEETLQTLDAADRNLILAKYVEGFRVSDLAAREGVSQKALESRLLRLRRDLRQRVLRKLEENNNEC